MMKVLIVDDSHILRQMFSDILESHDIRVTLASNGVEAIQKIQENFPDLVITDLVMPQMSGYELCRWIKKNPTTQSIPVVLCSTRSNDIDRYWGMKQGADAYLTKPFAPLELLKKIQELFPSSQSKYAF